MARLLFDIWLIRKGKTVQQIVDAGVDSESALSAFVDERSLTFPGKERLTDFHKCWSLIASKQLKDSSQKPNTKNVESSVEEAAETKKPAAPKKTTRTRRAPRKKPAIKDKSE